MTAAPVNPVECPACNLPYGVLLDNGTMLCPSCRHEWDPRKLAEVPAPVAEAPVAEVAAAETFPDAPEAEQYISFLTVLWRDGPVGNLFSDRYVCVTPAPHTWETAERAAIDFYRDRRGGEVESIGHDYRVPEWEDPDVAAIAEASGVPAAAIAKALDAADDRPKVPSLGGPLDTPEQEAALAAAYLETLTGTGVTLEGGQRATLLDFPDDDHATVQLGDGSVATVDFNDIIRADEAPPVTGAEVAELDDGTAAMFGDAVLTMAALVLEAGLLSVEGTGESAHLVETPTGWIPDDVDAIPLMEQAAAVAVATLVMAFDIPRDMIAAAVTQLRPATRGANAMEGQGNGNNER